MCGSVTKQKNQRAGLVKNEQIKTKNRAAKLSMSDKSRKTRKAGKRNFYDEANALFRRKSKSKIKSKNRVRTQITRDLDFEQ